MDQPVLFELQDGVATLTLNRPQRRNPFDAEMREGLAEALHRVRSDPQVHALVLTGAGGVFSAGGDVRTMQAALPATTWRQRLVQLQEDLIVPLLRLDRPVIAAVDGAAYGGGFSLALTADFVLASTRARFCMSFLKVGLVPDCGAWWTLPRFVGVQRAKELMLSAREVQAAEALALGIAMEVHEPAALMPRALALARSFAGASPGAVAAIKRGLDTGPGSDLMALLAQEADAQALAFTTPQHQAAVDRFLNKQPAAFQWPPAQA